MTPLPPIDAVPAQAAGRIFPDDLVAPIASQQTAPASSAFGDMVTQGLSEVNGKLMAG